MIDGLLKTDEALLVSINGVLKTLSLSNETGQEALRLYRENKLDELENLLTMKEQTVKGLKGFVVNHGIVYINDRPLPELLSQRMVQARRNNESITPHINFWKRLCRNPSRHSVVELFQCLEVNHHPIMPNGCFIAWKGVNKDFTDTWTGLQDYTPGNSPEMERNEVNDDDHNTCADGYHVASYKFAVGWAKQHKGRLIMVIVDPKDVVTVPTDGQFQKIRVCKFTSLKEVPLNDEPCLDNVYKG